MSTYVRPGEIGPSGYVRARRVTTFEEVFWRFVRGYDCHPYAARGYKSKGGEFFINKSLIARRKHGKVQMYLTEPRSHQYAIAEAIRKVMRECEEHCLLLHVCGEHEDCRENEELGVACWNDRHP